MSTPAVKREAAGTIETELEPDTAKAANRVDEANEKVMGGLRGWATATGMRTVQETWDGQVKALMGRLAHEKNALRAAATTLRATDVDRKVRIDAVRSSFDTY
ncbi:MULTISPECIES: hypothetical protein [unclassified Streptomyces]|uniref:hypothetical protein n=1 Tax=unclassified Streptomyces TaxID=2593676 RepID=UPI003317F5E3